MAVSLLKIVAREVAEGAVKQCASTFCTVCIEFSFFCNLYGATGLPIASDVCCLHPAKN